MGIDLGLLLAADVAVLQVAFDIGAVPAVGRAATQAPGADFMPGIGAEMVAVDRSAAVGAAAHVQRRVAVAGHQANACGLIEGAVHTGEHAADGGGVARGVVAAVGLAPCAQCLDPHVATAVDGLAGSAHFTVAQAFAHGFAHVAAVIDQRGFQRRVNLPLSCWNAPWAEAAVGASSKLSYTPLPAPNCSTAAATARWFGVAATLAKLLVRATSNCTPLAA